MNRKKKSVTNKFGTESIPVELGHYLCRFFSFFYKKLVVFRISVLYQKSSI